MKIVMQDTAPRDTAQQRPDSVTMATTMAPQPRMGPPQNSGYLVAVFIEAILFFGGYWLLLHRRSAKLRARHESTRSSR